MGDISIDPIFFSPSVSGAFPTLDKHKIKGKKNMSFKITVKNGHESYNYDQKSGTYKTKTEDYVEKFAALDAALQEFLTYVTDSYNEDKVTLTFSPKNNSKKGNK